MKTRELTMGEKQVVLKLEESEGQILIHKKIHKWVTKFLKLRIISTKVIKSLRYGTSMSRSLPDRSIQTLRYDSTMLLEIANRFHM